MTAVESKLMGGWSKPQPSVVEGTAEIAGGLDQPPVQQNPDSNKIEDKPSPINIQDIPEPLKEPVKPVNSKPTDQTQGD